MLSHAHLQRCQQVAGFPQSGPGGVQLLQQFVLRLLQRADVSLGVPDVLLPPLNALLQLSHLWTGQTDTALGRSANTLWAAVAVAAT